MLTMSPRTLCCLFVLVGIVSAWPDVLWGPKSAAKDDAPSSVTCPGDKFVVGCRCDNDKNCDGGQVSGNGKTCTVHNMYRKKGVKARAECMAPTLVVSNPDGFVKNPEIQCPTHYKVINCMYNSPWKQDDCMSQVAVKDNGCKVSECHRCSVNAVCLYKP